MHNLDNIISEVKKGQPINESDVYFVLNKLREILYQENNILFLQSPIVVCGDVHGQLDDVLYLFDISGGVEGQKFLFLGDYVDRGYFSLNTFLLLACYKLKYPDSIYLLRGNHEDRMVSQTYGFFHEILANYGHPGAWFACNEVFELLPISAIIDNELFAVHGGLSPFLTDISQISIINRRVDIPEKGILTDLLWSDPADRGSKTKRYYPSSRGNGHIFGEAQANEFLQHNKMKIILRSHQMVMEGHQYYFENQVDPRLDGALLLVWSAPNYSYRSGNIASVLKYKFSGKEDFDIVHFDTAPKRIEPPKKNERSPYFT
ncbi:hypothetical protein TRFO_17737 [Tritrichomonas foetus]|uniref:Serine/threonine-protein phosphatase n=1 Tax=Tritrichomonas foetus TaxID=1144522 RepID=A0A1J4KNH5_9EUKA|nr:hypothetical protein TRFO_17737 [Tritrichomonas foetus]|eukprot:OHT12456.1 hypothetical protein TRFO_17737 [Tritrichomonas foetus]